MVRILPVFAPAVAANSSEAFEQLWQVKVAVRGASFCSWCRSLRQRRRDRRYTSDWPN